MLLEAGPDFLERYKHSSEWALAVDAFRWGRGHGERHRGMWEGKGQCPTGRDVTGWWGCASSKMGCAGRPSGTCQTARTAHQPLPAAIHVVLPWSHRVHAPPLSRSPGPPPRPRCHVPQGVRTLQSSCSSGRDEVVHSFDWQQLPGCVPHSSAPYPARVATCRRVGGPRKEPMTLLLSIALFVAMVVLNRCGAWRGWGDGAGPRDTRMGTRTGFPASGQDLLSLARSRTACACMSAWARGLPVPVPQPTRVNPSSAATLNTPFPVLRVPPFPVVAAMYGAIHPARYTAAALDVRSRTFSTPGSALSTQSLSQSVSYSQLIIFL